MAPTPPDTTLPDAALFTGAVRHRRHTPHDYRFRQPLLMLFVNTDRIDALRQKLGWLAATGILGWRRRDYLPTSKAEAEGTTPSLTQAVLHALHETSGARAAGPVYLLAQPRQFGCAYNPASFYFICDGDATRAAHLLVEVHNTPWGERFCYAGSYNDGAGEDGNSATATSTMQKHHRVSPFNPLDMTYDWRYNQPRRRFFIHMRCRRGDATHFDATLLLQQRPLNRRTLARAMLARPFSAAASLAMIYWHALRLWWIKTPHYL